VPYYSARQPSMNARPRSTRENDVRSVQGGWRGTGAQSCPPRIHASTTPAPTTIIPTTSRRRASFPIQILRALTSSVAFNYRLLSPEARPASNQPRSLTRTDFRSTKNLFRCSTERIVPPGDELHEDRRWSNLRFDSSCFATWGGHPGKSSVLANARACIPTYKAMPRRTRFGRNCIGYSLRLLRARQCDEHAASVVDVQHLYDCLVPCEPGIMSAQLKRKAA
jgi:hypothetical protein